MFTTSYLTCFYIILYVYIYKTIFCIYVTQFVNFTNFGVMKFHYDLPQSIYLSIERCVSLSGDLYQLSATLYTIQ